MKRLYVVLAVLGALSLTGLPTAAAIFLWTVAIPFMQSLEQLP